jgi:MFS family permease
MSDVAVVSANAARTKVRLTVLLGLAVFINYVDRGSLATAAPLMSRELQFSPAQMGVLLSAFFWSYTPTQLVVGWLSERYGVRWLLAGGLALWSLATAATGLIATFASLLLLRALLGIGESVFFPCSSKVLSQTVGITERGRANAFISFCLALGPAAGTYAGGLLMADGQWRPVFIVFGLVSLIWLWPWLATPMPEAAPRPAHGQSDGPTWLDILKQRSAWGAALGHFCCNYGFYFVISWLPSYLVSEHGLTMGRMGQIGGTIYLLQAMSAMATGWTLDRAIKSGTSPNRAYKTAMLVSGLGSAACFVGCAKASPSVAIGCMLAGGVLIGIGTSGIFSIAQTLAGPRASGRWVGFQNFIGNFAGIIAPAVTGLIVDRTHHYSGAFMLAAGVVVVGALAWSLAVRSISPVEWRR